MALTSQPLSTTPASYGVSVWYSNRPRRFSAMKADMGRLKFNHCMKHVKKSVLLWYSAREMYELVVNGGDYPKFLPWCDSRTVLGRPAASPVTGAPAGMTARLGLSYAGVRQSFTTRNEEV